VEEKADTKDSSENAIEMGYETTIRVSRPGTSALLMETVPCTPNGSLSETALRTLEQFEKAVRAHETKGADNVESHDEIDREYDRTKKVVKILIQLLKFRAVKGDWLERELLS
jgi:hypothetical protein